MIEAIQDFVKDEGNVFILTFVLFWVLMYFVVRKPVLRWLDGEIAKISDELATAKDLREEAEAALQECKAKQAKAEADAEMIVNMAKQQAESLRKRTEEELASALAHQEQMVADRILIAEKKAVEAVRSAAISMALEIASKSLRQDLAPADASRLIDQAINEVPAFDKVKQG